MGALRYSGRVLSELLVKAYIVDEQREIPGLRSAPEVESNETLPVNIQFVEGYCVGLPFRA